MVKRLWRPERSEHLFYVTSSNRQVYREWHAIQKAAGIPKPYFGFHDLRRTCATELEQLANGAGTFMLGHSSPMVTHRHYNNPSAATLTAVEAMPQPFGFLTSQPNERTKR